MIRFIGARAIIAVLLVLLAPAYLWAQDGRPHSVLLLDQSNLRGPFYYQLSSGLREVFDADGHTTIYSENLDLTRFGGAAYEATLKQYLKEKYRDRSIGVIVANGAGTLDHTLRWREELWPGVPIVFAMLEASQLAGLGRLTNVTGVAVRNSLAGAVKIARVVIPDLDTIVLIGDSWDRQALFRHWGEEIPAATSGLKVIDLVGKKMSEILRRVAELPDRSAIVYSGVFSDGAGTYYPAATAMRLISEKANRPIVVAAEPLLAAGAIGGYSLIAREIGVETGKLALRILNGERAEDISPVTRESKPLFNWKQMQRWNVSESSLPEGSEIRFRAPTFLEQYRWQSAAVASAILIQAGLIMFLLHERHLRHNAETESHKRMTELAHVNRQATTGELSSSIAHELNQPLGSILANAETAELMLKSDKPDLDEIREILADIRRDDQRAGEVIRRLRGFLKRAPFETRDIDLNEIMGEAFGFLSVQASARNVALYLQTAPGALRIKGDPIQLQQVVLNLVVNAMDAMATIPYGRTVIGRTQLDGESSAVISISDSGPGIPADKLAQVFDPFFTTKDQGMGIGLSIARTIVLAHKGHIWAENQSGGGAAFHFTLPLAA
ncbi:ABC transporter substrate binding protein [Bradyrhizobium sp. BWA-3-5]|uniref:sensor histidine kinase n=1 Tax=Bradyrhizobium sp. BWA-3-5 TaxID=3080013 RepID=UPI00293E92EA|nr:ABC transporter substrate binding protein [Bradyrhizobium sp. BWA-3-5]WOH67920.1 ABC transporter substrate binding protein [Bradyrhizobium sp. BWA-3-5]